MDASIGKVELPDRPSMNDTSAGKLAQTQFISSTIKVRHPMEKFISLVQDHSIALNSRYI